MHWIQQREDGVGVISSDTGHNSWTQLLSYMGEPVCYYWH